MLHSLQPSFFSGNLVVLPGWFLENGDPGKNGDGSFPWSPWHFCSSVPNASIRSWPWDPWHGVWPSDSPLTIVPLRKTCCLPWVAGGFLLGPPVERLGFRAPTFSVVYFRGTLPSHKGGEKGHLAGGPRCFSANIAGLTKAAFPQTTTAFSRTTSYFPS